MNSLVGLSLVWLSLCAVLVVKHQHLLAVFISFVSSFGIAAVFSGRTWLPANKPYTPLDRAANTRARNVVGLIACTTSFWCLSCHEHYSFLLPSSEYMALSICSGYLAFDHWFSALFCEPPTKPMLLVIEDAVSLAIILCALTTSVDSVDKYRPIISTWIAYKTLRLALQIDNGSAPGNRNDEAEPLEKSPFTQSVDVPQKNVDPSKIWIIHGQTFDLAKFVDAHPGGKESILLGRGRDCTALFESYHPFTSLHRRVLAKYQVNFTSTKAASSQQEVVPVRDEFYDILCQRVAKALREKGMDPMKHRSATILRLGYYAMILTALVVSGMAHSKGSILGSFFFAVFGWLIGAVGHDAGHFAASRVSWFNDVGLWGMSLLCNPIMWQHQHTYAHHSFTNEYEVDPDLHHFEMLLRVHRRLQHKDIYKNQSNWAYVALAYTLVVFGTCIWIPIGMMTEGSLYGFIEWTDRKRPLRAVGMLAHLLGYFLVIVVLPFRSMESWPKALLAVVVHIATSGLLFGIFSQINHLNEHSLLDEKERVRRDVDRKPEARDSWAVSQIESSNNFSPQSLLWHVLSNGLNLQIEHHLFPSLNHCHLSHIAPVVEACCKEYGVKYKCYHGWKDLMNATLDWLDRLSVEES